MPIIGGHVGFLVFEEMAGAFNLFVGDRDALLVAQLANKCGGILHRCHPVGGAIDDQTRGGAGRKEGEVIHVGGRRYRDEPGDFRAPHQKLHADPGPEGKARDPAMFGVGVHRLQIVKRRGGI